MWVFPFNERRTNLVELQNLSNELKDEKEFFQCEP